MKRVVLLSVAALLACAPATLAARGNSHPSNISIESTCEVPCIFKAPQARRGQDTLLVSGLVDSNKQTCVADRKVTIFEVFTGGSTTTIDTATTSGHGAWSGFGDFNGAERIRAKLAKKTFGPQGNRQVCEADVAELLLP